MNRKQWYAGRRVFRCVQLVYNAAGDEAGTDLYNKYSALEQQWGKFRQPYCRLYNMKDTVESYQRVKAYVSANPDAYPKHTLSGLKERLRSCLKANTKAPRASSYSCTPCW